MPRPPTKSPPLPSGPIVRDLPPETRELLAELTSLVIQTVPEATQKLNLRRKTFGFNHPDVGHFCEIFPREERVVIAFEFGVLLPDPDGILDARTCAKQVRYLPIGSHDRVPCAALRHFLRAAVSLPAEYSTRVALAKAGARLVTPRRRRRKRAPAKVGRAV